MIEDYILDKFEANLKSKSWGTSCQKLVEFFLKNFFIFFWFFFFFFLIFTCFKNCSKTQTHNLCQLSSLWSEMWSWYIKLCMYVKHLYNKLYFFLRWMPARIIHMPIRGMIKVSGYINIPPKYLLYKHISSTWNCFQILDIFLPNSNFPSMFPVCHTWLKFYHDLFTIGL